MREKYNINKRFAFCKSDQKRLEKATKELGFPSEAETIRFLLRKYSKE